MQKNLKLPKIANQYQRKAIGLVVAIGFSFLTCWVTEQLFGDFAPFIALPIVLLFGMNVQRMIDGVFT